MLIQLPKKTETIFIVTVFLILSGMILFNFQSAKVKSRDQQRKNDLKRTYSALNAYLTEVGKFPSAKDGKMVACNGKPCEWGKDSLVFIDDLGNTRVYQDIIPQDPLQKDGFSYVYFSDLDQYQILAHLESTDDPEYMPEVAARQIKCGTQIANYGVANSGTTLDKSVDEQAKPKDLP